MGLSLVGVMEEKELRKILNMRYCIKRLDLVEVLQWCSDMEDLIVIGSKRYLRRLELI